MNLWIVFQMKPRTTTCSTTSWQTTYPFSLRSFFLACGMHSLLICFGLPRRSEYSPLNNGFGITIDREWAWTCCRDLRHFRLKKLRIRDIGTPNSTQVPITIASSSLQNCRGFTNGLKLGSSNYRISLSLYLFINLRMLSVEDALSDIDCVFKRDIVLTRLRTFRLCRERPDINLLQNHSKFLSKIAESCRELRSVQFSIECGDSPLFQCFPDEDNRITRLSHPDSRLLVSFFVWSSASGVHNVYHKMSEWQELVNRRHAEAEIRFVLFQSSIHIGIHWARAPSGWKELQLARVVMSITIQRFQGGRSKVLVVLTSLRRPPREYFARFPWDGNVGRIFCISSSKTPLEISGLWFRHYWFQSKEDNNSLLLLCGDVVAIGNRINFNPDKKFPDDFFRWHPIGTVNPTLRLAGSVRLYIYVG